MVDQLEDELRDPTEVANHINHERLVTEPLTYVDVGARGGLSPSLHAVRTWLHVIFFEPDPNEFQRLRESSPSTSLTTVLPYAIGAADGPARLHLTRKRACSSLLEPKGNMSGLFSASVDGAGNEYGDITRFDVEATANVDCKTLTSALSGVTSHVDILKIDTQGLEFEVLRGLGSFRPFLLNVECSTTELYRSQSTVFEVGSLLRGLGYFPATLMDRHLVPHRGSQKRDSIPLHGDCIFVPDGSPLGLKIIQRDPQKWLAALGVHGLLGLGLWQAKEFSIEYGK